MPQDNTQQYAAQSQTPSAQPAQAQASEPLHQYAPAPRPTYPVSPSYPAYPAKTGTTTQALNAGIFGLIVMSTGTLGANLNKVQAGEMSMGKAFGDSLAKGLTGGVAAASATAAAGTLTSGGAAGLAVTLAAATGVSYLINKL